MQVSNSKVSFLSAVLLVKSEEHASVERNALKSVGIRNIRIICSGLDYLKEQIEKFKEPDHNEIIFCHEELKDMTSFEFMDIFFKHHFLQTVPVIALLDRSIDDSVGFLKRHNFSGLLVRPYTQDKLIDQLSFAKKIQSVRIKIFEQNKDVATLDPFFEALNTYITNHHEEEMSPERALVHGMSELKAKKYNEAIKLLSIALDSYLCAGDANYALAFAWRAKNLIARSKDSFEMAALNYFELESWDKFKKACLGYNSISSEKSIVLTELAITLFKNESFSMPLKAIKSEAVLFDLDKISKEINSFDAERIKQIVRYIKQYEVDILLIYFENSSSSESFASKFFKKFPKREAKPVKEAFTLAEEDLSPKVPDELLEKSQVQEMEISGLIKGMMILSEPDDPKETDEAKEPKEAYEEEAYEEKLEKQNEPNEPDEQELEKPKKSKIAKEKASRTKDEIGMLVESLIVDDTHLPKTMERQVEFGKNAPVIQPLEQEISKSAIGDIIKGIKLTHKLHKDSQNK